MNERANGQGEMGSGYGKLFISLGMSLLVMFPLTMAFVNVWGDFYLNLSNFYMAMMMLAPMGLIMLLVMRSMFPSRRVNTGLAAGFVALFFIAFFIGRQGVFVGNDQFLRAMIPHHSRAILVCEESAITNPEIVELCDQIIAAQREEIAIMKRIMEENKRSSGARHNRGSGHPQSDPRSRVVSPW